MQEFPLQLYFPLDPHYPVAKHAPLDRGFVPRAKCAVGSSQKDFFVAVFPPSPQDSPETIRLSFSGALLQLLPQVQLSLCVPQPQSKGSPANKFLDGFNGRFGPRPKLSQQLFQLLQSSVLYGSVDLVDPGLNHQVQGDLGVIRRFPS